MFQQITYRIWQFIQIVRAQPLSPEELNQIQIILNPEECALFERQSNADQQHGFRVMSALIRAGHDDRDLLAAALLHDVGKAMVESYWWDRVIVVLGQALAKDKIAGWAAGEMKGLARPFVIKERHSEWGAKAAEGAGSSETTIFLIRQHHDIHLVEENGHKEIGRIPESETALRALKWADDLS